jgi:hypothetical protein
MTWWRKSISLLLQSDVRRGRLRRQEKGDPVEVIKCLLETATLAEAQGNANGMHRSSYKLIRFELYERAWELRIRAATMKQRSPLPEWEGGDLSNRTILIRAYSPKHRVGEELRLSRFIAPVAQRARHCIVLAEHRLVPLLRRSFPGTDVRPRDTDDTRAFAEADVAAYYETIASHYAKNAEQMRRCFVPLRPDPTRVDLLRQRYNPQSHGLLIGISWTSRTKNKVLPDLKSWAPLLGWPSATFVSLQYGDIQHDLESIQEFAGCRVIHDPEIDPLVDLDGFAAQISALDAVVSISNTTIDMAGMLGMPTLHVRDDKGHGIWPERGPSPWYPDMIFIYRQHRPWSEAFAEAKNRLEQMMFTPPKDGRKGIAGLSIPNSM